MIGLTEKGKALAINLGVLLSFGCGVYVMGHHAGMVTERTSADERDAVRTHAALLVATASADSLARVTNDLLRLAELSKVPHARAILHTDTAAVSAALAREHAERAALDSAATAVQLRVQIDRLAAADSLLDLRFHQERDAAQKRFAFDSLALASAEATIQKKSLAIESAARDYSALEQVVRDLRGQQRGVVHRVVTGTITVVSAATCGALGSLAGPVAALGAAGVCTAFVSILAP